jgi:hypothetical protein
MYEIEGWFRENLNLRNILVWHHPNLYGAGLSYGSDRYKFVLIIKKRKGISGEGKTGQY